MQCRSCSAEIADKAIVCYRCGTPTAAPTPVRGARAGSTGRSWWLGVAVIAALLAAALAYVWLM